MLGRSRRERSRIPRALRLEPFPGKGRSHLLGQENCLTGSPDFFDLGKLNYVVFRWKVKGRIYRQEQDYTHLKGDWAPDIEECIQDYKEVSRAGYDVVDCCSTQDYLYMRKFLPMLQRLSDA